VTLKDDQPAVNGGAGYFATWDAAFNPTASKFGSWYEPNAGATDTGGHRVEYVIHRMCALVGGATEKDGAPVGQECVTLEGALKSGSKGGVQYGEKALPGSAQVYYRITARVQGPKNSVSVVQAMVY
jgi:hypothetical protein